MTHHYSDQEIIRQLTSTNHREVEAGVKYLLDQFRGLVRDLVKNQKDCALPDIEPILHDATTDLVQNVQVGKYQPGRSSLSTYFYAIAKHKLLNLARYRQRRKEIQNEDKLTQQIDNIEIEDSYLMSEEVRKKLAAAIAKLNKPCQQILIEYWLEERPLKEIGQEMGLSFSAIKKRHQRCKQHLRDILGEDFEDLNF